MPTFTNTSGITIADLTTTNQTLSVSGLSGQITSAIYRGARRSLVCEAGALRFNVEVSASEPAPTSGPVAIAAKPGGAWAVRP